MGCFVRGVKKWHGMFCPGMFCPAPLLKVRISSQRERIISLMWYGRTPFPHCRDFPTFLKSGPGAWLLNLGKKHLDHLKELDRHFKWINNTRNQQYEAITYLLH